MPLERSARRQVPGRALEQVGARVLDAGASRRRRAGGRRRSAGRRPRARDQQRLVEPTSVTTLSPPAARAAPRRPARAARPPARTRSRRRPRDAPPRPIRRRASDRAALERAARARCGSGSQPTDVAPASRSRAASPIEPPISPTPRTAIRTSAAVFRARDSSLPRVAAARLDLLARSRANSSAGTACGPVADRRLGVVVDLDDDPVGARRGGGQRQRQHRSRRPAAWLGSTTTGRCESCFSTGTAMRSSVKRSRSRTCGCRARRGSRPRCPP